ncbi:MAG: hypothetical protein HYY92_00680 [Parcubacteria group bacterium]|nr:hypothetical protein [Parcubacteria group bacterium]
MTPLDFFATLFAAFVLVKLAIVLVKPKFWMDYVVIPLYKNALITSAVYFVILAFSVYYLYPYFLGSEFGAAAWVLIFLVGLGFVPYGEVVVRFREQMLRDGIKKAWFAALVWAGLALWILWSIWW